MKNAVGGEEMPTIQLVLDRETSARLAFLAEQMGKRKVDVAVDLLKRAVYQQYNDLGNGGATLQALVQNPPAPPRPRSQAVLYTGSDSRLQSGKIYASFAEVLRIVRPDLAKLWPDGKLYNAKTHGGDKAENILKHYEPSVYKGLFRTSNNRGK